MTTQPETLRLADELEFKNSYVGGNLLKRSAFRLRRLHEMNQELLEALETISDHAPWGGSKDKYIAWLISVATAAIAKATGEQA